MGLWCDPPEGWKYGFPKAFTFQPSVPWLSKFKHFKELEDWFIAQGYPRKMVRQGKLKLTRYWREADGSA